MLKLIREETSAVDAVAQRHQWAVKFSASYTVDESPAKIFVMQQALGDGVFADSLSCVASATQMTDLPEDEPESGSPFYRVAEVTKLCRSATAATEFVEKVKDATQDLVDNLNAAESLSIAEEFVVAPS